MTPAICGHGRDNLIWALKLWATITSGGVAMYAAGTGRGKVAKSNAFGDVNDPAKLAELLAEAAQLVGLDMSPNASLPNYDWTRFRVYPNHHGTITLEDFDQLNPQELTLQQARSIVLRILELPKGATPDDAVKALTNAS